MSHVQKVIGFVRSLPSEDDLDGIAKQVFRSVFYTHTAECRCTFIYLEFRVKYSTTF